MGLLPNSAKAKTKALPEKKEQEAFISASLLPSLFPDFYWNR